MKGWDRMVITEITSTATPATVHVIPYGEDKKRALPLSILTTQLRKCPDFVKLCPDGYLVQHNDYFIHAVVGLLVLDLIGLILIIVGGVTLSAAEIVIGVLFWIVSVTLLLIPRNFQTIFNQEHQTLREVSKPQFNIFNRGLTSRQVMFSDVKGISLPKKKNAKDDSKGGVVLQIGTGHDVVLVPPNKDMHHGLWAELTMGWLDYIGVHPQNSGARAEQHA